MKLFKKRNTSAATHTVIPEHIAIIMDGNGRWASRRGLPRTAGHAAGSETFRNIATYCKNIGVKYLTVYAFSTENWKRPKGEVDAIMNLLDKYLHEAIEKMERDGIRLVIFGDTSPLSDSLKKLIEETNSLSRNIDGFQVNLCLNYGGRDEICKGAQEFARLCLEGKYTPEELTPALFSNYLYSKGVPDPDLVIRPSGEVRISNFLLWQSAYSEFYFTDLMWPEFTPAEIDKAIESYSKRERRFGAVGAADSRERRK